MKTRYDFVTNSSSSSYIVVYKINADETTLREEFGKLGQAIMDKYACTKEELEDVADSNGYPSRVLHDLADDGLYLIGERRSGWGGDYDVEDDEDIKLASVLAELGFAEKLAEEYYY